MYCLEDANTIELRTFFRSDHIPAGRAARRLSAPHNGQGHRLRIVVVGGGFGGLAAMRALKGAPVDVTLIDRRNFHLFQPLLYQVATGQLSPGDIASPLRALFAHQRNVSVLEDEVLEILPSEQRVILREGQSLHYDVLVLSAGSTAHYFGRNDWAPFAPGLKSVEDATAIRSQILSVFEKAERTKDRELRDALLTFVIVGGGPTGVELAGAIGELTQHTLKNEYRTIRTPEAKILLIEGADRILPSYPETLSRSAYNSLHRLGVTVLPNTLVAEMANEGVTLRQGERTWHVPAHTVLWAAGVKASPLGAILAECTGAKMDDAGRLRVEADCTLPGHPNIFVVGDMAHFDNGMNTALPGVAPVAMQQGAYVAQVIRRRLRGQAARPFRYRDWGRLAVIGRAAAVANVGRFRFTGFFAWFLWLFVHIMQLVEFENRLLVLTQWLFSYVTGKRSARLITQRRT